MHSTGRRGEYHLINLEADPVPKTAYGNLKASVMERRRELLDKDRL